MGQAQDADGVACRHVVAFRAVTHHPLHELHGVEGRSVQRLRALPFRRGQVRTLQRARSDR